MHTYSTPWADTEDDFLGPEVTLIEHMSHDGVGFGTYCISMTERKSSVERFDKPLSIKQILEMNDGESRMRSAGFKEHFYQLKTELTLTVCYRRKQQLAQRDLDQTHVMFGLILYDYVDTVTLEYLNFPRHRQDGNI